MVEIIWKPQNYSYSVRGIPKLVSVHVYPTDGRSPALSGTPVRNLIKKSILQHSTLFDWFHKIYIWKMCNCPHPLTVWMYLWLWLLDTHGQKHSSEAPTLHHDSLSVPSLSARWLTSSGGSKTSQGNFSFCCSAEAELMHCVCCTRWVAALGAAALRRVGSWTALWVLCHRPPLLL